MPRYIDAEPFKGMSIMKPFNVEINAAPYSTPGSYTVTEYIRVKDIDEVPTADVQEVKHGKWIQDHGWYSHHCSNCGRSTSAYVEEDGDLYDRVFNFCPNCGAKMDGE